MKNYWRGLVRLRISGRYPERFLNLCMQNKISVFKLERRNNNFFVWLRVADFFRLPPLVRRAKVRVRIVERYGLPFVWQRWRRRRVLLGGLSLFFIALYYLSLHIWLIEIETANEPLREAVTASLSRAGVRAGMAKAALDQRTLTCQLTAENPSVAWAGIENNGVKLTIRLVEKELPPSKTTDTYELRAVKGGTIIRSVALTGESLVQSGDIVERGAPLIADSDGQAGGIVLARVSYEETASLPLTQYTAARTGDKSYGFRLCLLGRPLADYAAGDKYLYADREEYRKKLCCWRNQEPFVELFIDIYYELTVDYEKLSVPEAHERALLKAQAELGQRLPQDACIIEQSVIAEDLTDDIYSITLRAVTEEDIAGGSH